MPGNFPFPRFLVRTPIQVSIDKGLDKNGEPNLEPIYNGKCIYDEKSKRVLDAERRLVQLSARAIIEGDIFPGQDIQGVVLIGGVERIIFRSSRPRNPDGTVYSTELELM